MVEEEEVQVVVEEEVQVVVVVCRRVCRRVWCSVSTSSTEKASKAATCSRSTGRVRVGHHSSYNHYCHYYRRHTATTIITITTTSMLSLSSCLNWQPQFRRGRTNSFLHPVVQAFDCAENATAVVSRTSDENVAATGPDERASSSTCAPLESAEFRRLGP